MAQSSTVLYTRARNRIRFTYLCIYIRIIICVHKTSGNHLVESQIDGNSTNERTQLIRRLEVYFTEPKYIIVPCAHV